MDKNSVSTSMGRLFCLTFANSGKPRSMYLIEDQLKNLHHIKTYGEVTEWPYNNSSFWSRVI